MDASKQSAQITIYTLPWCVHCARAKSLLLRRELVYREVDGSEIPDFRGRLVELTGGVSVPQIVIDGTPVGGAAQLARLDRVGVLIPIVRRQPFPIVRERKRISPRSFARWAANWMRGCRDGSPIERRDVLVDREGCRVRVAA